MKKKYEIIFEKIYICVISISSSSLQVSLVGKKYQHIADV